MPCRHAHLRNPILGVRINCVERIKIDVPPNKKQAGTRQVPTRRLARMADSERCEQKKSAANCDQTGGPRSPAMTAYTKKRSAFFFFFVASSALPWAFASALASPDKCAADFAGDAGRLCYSKTPANSPDSVACTDAHFALLVRVVALGVVSQSGACSAGTMEAALLRSSRTAASFPDLSACSNASFDSLLKEELHGDYCSAGTCVAWRLGCSRLAASLPDSAAFASASCALLIKAAAVD